MLELAAVYGTGPTRLGEIAQKQDISVKYLERMMHSMVTAGLVRSIRGQGGGFTLARSPEAIRLSQIVQAAEGPLSIVECVEDPALCSRYDICVTREIWERLSVAIADVLETYTLQDMVDMHRKKTINNVQGTL